MPVDIGAPVEMKFTASLVERKLREKERLAAMLESQLTSREVRAAAGDGHAKRRPRPCGLTIHTGVGCSFGCIYCYVPDMGFPMRPRPYPLTGLQLVYALSVNPFFVPGLEGTLLAFGSVTEPFMSETFSRAIEYLEHTKRYLGNPQQVSTKAALSEEQVEALARSADPRIDVLVSVSTIRLASRLEPGAPSPRERLRSASYMVKRGMSVTLFVRPIIPGVTDREANAIFSEAKIAGIDKVVLGSLRVTPGILRRLRALGFIDVAGIERRLPRRPTTPKDQVVVLERDVKLKVEETARKHGLMVLPSSCSSNVHAHGLYCNACKWGPCGTGEPPQLDLREIAEAAEILGCGKAAARLATIRGTGRSVLEVECLKPKESRVKAVVAAWLETLTKLQVVVS
ncbi:MAG: radical SAM protein [Thermoproteota archaeon]